MKKILVIILSVLSLFMLASCGEKNSMDNNIKPDYSVATLEGKWVGYRENKNKKDWDYRYEATIEDGIIEIRRVINQLNPLYPTNVWWFGTYTDPEGEVSEYSWESIVDEEKIEPGEATIPYKSRMFTYENGLISFLLNPEREHDRFNPYIYLEKVEE